MLARAGDLSRSVGWRWETMERRTRWRLRRRADGRQRRAGVDVLPAPTQGLMGISLLSGAVVSEYPPGTEPKGAHYHDRNCIISGLRSRR